MRPSVAYWCSSFEPEIEAVAKEVAILRREFPQNALWGVSDKRLLQCSRTGGFAFHSRLHHLFNVVTGHFQSNYDVNHLYGSLGDWFHLKALRGRPSIMTVALDSEPCDRALLRKIDRFVVEWPDAGSDLKELGIEDQRISLIYPPVDLSKFVPSTPPETPFTVLFASSPDLADWLEDRGVDIVLDAAKLRPEINFHLCWRPWGNSIERLRELIAEKSLTNLAVSVGRIEEMSSVYQRAHVTVFCPRHRHRSKPAPNSIIESMACGRPVVVTSTVGLAPLIKKAKAGSVIAPMADQLATALDHLRENWSVFSVQARQAAEASFDERTFVDNYSGIYRDLVASCSAG